MRIEIQTKQSIEKLIKKELRVIWKEIYRLNDKLGEVERLATGVRFEK